MTDETITLEFIARQLQRVLDEQATMRDHDMVVTGILTRVEGAVLGLTQEVAALRSLLLRHDRQLRDLETR